MRGPLYDRAGDSTEEFVREVFFRIWMHRERLLLTESITGYLYAVARSVSLNRLARSQIEDAYIHLTAMPEDSTSYAKQDSAEP